MVGDAQIAFNMLACASRVNRIFHLSFSCGAVLHWSRGQRNLLLRLSRLTYSIEWPFIEFSLNVKSRDVEEVLFLWKRRRKRENSTASASTLEGRMEGEKKLVLLSFGEERVGRA